MGNDKRFPDKYHVSTDELQHRENIQEDRDENVKKATAIIEEAILKVLVTLGVDVENQMLDIKTQQDALGIVITEETRPEMGGLMGFFIIAGFPDNPVPIAFIGDARLDNLGLVWVDINWIQEERLEHVGGKRMMQ